MKRILILAALLALAACSGGYSGPSTDDITPSKAMVDLTADEVARLYAKANACIADNYFWPPWDEPLITGPGFEACPGIMAELKAKYRRDAERSAAEQKAADAKAEADDLARRRRFLAAP